MIKALVLSSLMPEDTTDLTLVCDCGKQARYTCIGEPFYKKFQGKRYCVLHYPGNNKSAEFEKALKRKLDNKDFNFREVVFPDNLLLIELDFDKEVDFTFATFNANVYFNNSTFNAEVYFNNATFNARVHFDNASFKSNAYFSDAIFCALAYFSGAAFNAKSNFNFARFNKAADFTSTTFSAESYFIGAAFFTTEDPNTLTDASLSWSVSFRSATFSAETNFTSAAFEGANFVLTTFSAEVSFSGAIFSAESYRRPAVAFFISATFGAVAYFNDTEFKGEAFFSSANFIKGAEFISATFLMRADFNGATFSANVDFSFAKFGQTANFKFATFKDYVTFAGDENRAVFIDKTSLDLQFARTEKPELVSFHTLTLRPYWFVNADPRKFNFTNIDWAWASIDKEVKGLKVKGISQPNRLLSIACRNLSVNAEENHRYEEASKLRYMAMDARRSEHWRGLAFWRLSWWYWLASGYGERLLRAFVVLIGIWLLFAILYTHVGFARRDPGRASEKEAMTEQRDERSEPLNPSRSLTYSLGVMTLQKPEPRPATTTAQWFVILETVLGPLQAALLALAIRRKFMR